MQSNSYPNNVYPSLSDPVYASTVEGKVGPYKSLYRRVAFKRDAFVNTTALQDVSMQATGTTIQATNAPLGANIEIVSTSANDTAAGSGARKVVIHYLDANFAEADMEVTLNGTTPVNLGTVCQYINFVHVSSIGTAGGIAAGTISIRNVATPTTLYSTISGENVDMTSLFTVPAGYSALLTHIEVNVFHSSANTNNRVTLRVDACDWGGHYIPRRISSQV